MTSVQAYGPSQHLAGNTVYWGTHNIGYVPTDDPMFVYPVPPASAPTQAGDYHLSIYSASLEVGAPSGIPTSDLEGNPRPFPTGTDPDMGAYEDVGFDDIWSADTPADNGYEPNPDNGPMWVSNAIRVSTTAPANWFMMGHDFGNHVNPVYGQNNYVYVEIANRGNDIVDAGSEVIVYVAKASTGLSWDVDWVNNYSGTILYGDEIGSVVIPNDLYPGDEATVVVPWFDVPNPHDYGPYNEEHFCLLARIEETPTAPFGMTFAETTDVYANTRNNNNVAWRNLNIIAASFNHTVGHIIVRGLERAATPIRLAFKFDNADAGAQFLAKGSIIVTADAALYAKWVAGGSKGSGIKAIGENRWQIMSPTAYVENITLKNREAYWVTAQFAYTPNPETRDQRFHVVQLTGRGYTKVNGGVSYDISQARK